MCMSPLPGEDSTTMVHLRKGELKAETACRAVAHLDCAAVRNDRILHDGKAETCTAGFAGAARSIR